jgi:hypothetical protein
VHAFDAAGARTDRSDEEVSFRVRLTALRTRFKLSTYSNQFSYSWRRAEQQTQASTPTRAELAASVIYRSGSRQLELK